MPEEKPSLFTAIGKGDVAAVKALLPSIDFKQEYKNGAHEVIAAAKAGEAEIVGLLIKAGAAKDGFDSEGWTPLMHAAAEGKLEVIKTLLDHGAGRNSQALSIAASHKQDAAVRLLLERGVVPEPKRTRERDYGAMSSEAKHLLEKAHDRRAAARGAALTPLDRQLLDAAFVGDARKAADLLGKGAKADAHIERGAPALVIAAKRGHLAVVELLIEKGANINSVEDLTGQTALMKAVVFERLGVVKLLLAKGADKTRQDAKGQTAEALAKTDAVRALL